MSVSLSEKASANVAYDLNTNYNKIVENCGSATRPAFLCSGNLIRFTSTSRNYHTWDPSPTSIQTGGVSFTYIRQDINVNVIFRDKTSGIIDYPSMLKPYWKGRAEVICIFPTDGWTSNGREGGCGASVNFPDSKSCQEQGIETVDANKKMLIQSNYQYKRFLYREEW